ncbi:MAG: hypothetical protein ACJASX_001453 [Limisphaerales bacterium]|jgi:hypothetical protein
MNSDRRSTMKKTVVVPATWDLPDAIKNRFGEKAGRQRAM